MRFFSDLAGTLRAAFRVGLGMLDASGLTAARTHALPNKSGTIALLDDVSGGAGLIADYMGGKYDGTMRSYDSAKKHYIVTLAVNGVPTAVTTAVAGAYLQEAGYWYALATGTGAGITRPIANQNYLRLVTGTTATGVCRITAADGVLFRWPNQLWVSPRMDPATFGGAAASAAFAMPTGLSASAQEYSVLANLGPLDADPATAIGASLTQPRLYLMYDRLSSTNLVIRYVTEAGVLAQLDTGIAVSSALQVGVWAKIEKVDGEFVATVRIWHANNTSVVTDFTITDLRFNSSVWQASGPIVNAAWFGYDRVRITKTTGTTSVAMTLYSAGFCVAM